MKHFNIEICNLCMLLNYKLKQDHIIKFGIIKKKNRGFLYNWSSLQSNHIFRSTTFPWLEAVE